MWTQTSAPITNWTAVASSADGAKLVAVANGGVGPGPSYIVAPGPIYISTDAGNTWTQASNAPYADWRAVASSADGNKLAAVAYGGEVHTSVDAGLTWTSTSAPKTNWVSVASSADGNKLAALALVFPPPDFYTSSDSGNTWAAKASPYDRWIAIASSADGNKLVACGPGTVLASTNSGGSWATNTFGNGAFSGVAASADGKRLFVAGQKIYLSTNSGSAWFPISAFAARRIASSAEGRILVAVAFVAYTLTCPIYVSTNYGATWTTNLPLSTNLWTSVASSADGNKLVAIVNGGGIWVSQTTPAPSLNIKAANGVMALSWVVPSANLALHESSSLTVSNWTEVTNPPTLNLSTLQYEVALSLSNGARFYRLQSKVFPP